MPIPKLALKVTQHVPLQEDINLIQLLNGLAPLHSKAAMSKAGFRSASRTTMPNAPPIHMRAPILTFNHHSMVAAHEVPLITLTPPMRPTMRILDPRGEMSAQFLGQRSQDPPTN